MSTLRLDPVSRSSEVSPGTPSVVMYPCSLCEDITQMSTQSRPRTSVVAAKGQDDQEIVVDAKVKAIQVDDLFPPSRGKRTFVQWDAAASLQRFVD